MMLAWKSAACLAAGNTLVLKPAQVSTHRHTLTLTHTQSCGKNRLRSDTGDAIDGPEIC